MPPRISAGLAVYRICQGQLEVFLAHPGGPFFARKDAGHWTIPKGEIEPGEEYLATALREFKEEIGIEIDPKNEFLKLGSIRQKGGKIVHAWAVRQDWPGAPAIKSNLCQLEWPPASGRVQNYPEVDRAQFFPIVEAREKIKETQIPLLDRLEQLLSDAK